MKKMLTLAIMVVVFATLLCGCCEEYAVKVSKNGKTRIGIMTAIPVETMEQMQEDGTGEEYAQELGDMKIKTIDGVKCYVGEEIKNFSSTTKANKYMLKEYGEANSGVFKEFKVTTKEFVAIILDDMKETAALMGEDFKTHLKITFPYTITKTNGTLSNDKKTVTFDLFKTAKPYAYTIKSNKSAKVYFKKDYLKSNTSAYLGWNSVKGAKKYKLEYKANGDKKWKSVTTTKTYAIIKKLNVGKKYTFKVTAITKNKKYTSITTTETTLKKIAVKASKTTNKSVQLSWKKNTSADGYIVYQKTSKTGKWKAVKTIRDEYMASYTVKKLKSNKKYYFKVVSYSNQNGTKVKSPGVTIAVKTLKL